jgi:hypothetical protein
VSIKEIRSLIKNIVKRLKDLSELVVKPTTNISNLGYEH